jgi:putative ABC transport system substrate-binding protein
VDGRNITIERRSTEGNPERMPALMREVVALGVDVIVTTAGADAQRATDRIPIVAAVDSVLDKALIASLARPGRNLTGIGENNPAIYGKQLQLLKEAVPAIARVAVLAYRPGSGQRDQWRTEMETAARELRVTLLWIAADTPRELDAAFATIVRERADALYALGNHVNYANRQQIADFALKQRLPSFGFPEEGMLMLYEADFLEVLRRLAVYVKRILDGTKPSDLPFEQPKKYSLTINVRTAKALGLTIPKELLLRADEVIQ